MCCCATAICHDDSSKLAPYRRQAAEISEISMASSNLAKSGMADGSSEKVATSDET